MTSNLDYVRFDPERNPKTLRDVWKAKRKLKAAETADADARAKNVQIPAELIDELIYAVLGNICKNDSCPDPWCGFAHKAVEDAEKWKRNGAKRKKSGAIAYALARELPAISDCTAADDEIEVEFGQMEDQEYWPRSEESVRARRAWVKYLYLIGNIDMVSQPHPS